MSAGKKVVCATVAVACVLIVRGAHLTAGSWGGACGNPSSSAISSDWPFAFMNVAGVLIRQSEKHRA